MPDFKGNINNWIRLSEPDYYMFFLKTWIPFNAWYVVEMPQHKKRDYLIIKDLLESPQSKPKLKIISLLKNSDYESNLFKFHLGALHLSLEKRSLSHNGKMLTFTDVNLSENHVTFKSDSDKFSHKYKAERKSGHFEAIIVNSNKKTIFNYKNSKYNLEHFKADIDYSTLKPKIMQSKIMACFMAINPKKSTNLLTKSRRKNEYLLLEKSIGVRFINNNEIIAKSVIKILYSLRCMLFHGEVDPTESNKDVYKHAFHLLKIIISELK